MGRKQHGGSESYFVLGVAPNDTYGESLESALAKYDLDVGVEFNLESAMDTVRNHPVDCIVVPDELGSTTGREVLEKAREIKPDIPVIVLVDESNRERIEGIAEAGVTDYLVGDLNSVSFGRLSDRIRAAVSQYHAKKAQRSEREIVDRLDGKIRETKQKITSLHGVAMRLSSSSDEDEIYQEVVDAAETILNLDICFVFAAEKNEFVPKAHSSTPTERELHPVPIGTGVMGKTYKTGKSSRDVDIDLHPDAEKMFGEYRSGLSIPIGEFGVFQAVAKQPGAFDDIDLQLAELLASHAGSALRRLEYEEKLRVERDHYASLFNNTTDCIVEIEYVNGEPIVKSANTSFEEVFGYKEEEIAGESLDNFIVPENYEEEAERLNKQAKDSEFFHTEVRRQTKDGLKNFLVRSVYLYEDTSFAVYTDISERKKREEELEKQNERFRALFENVQEVVVEYVIEDGEPIVETVNEAFEEVFGYKEEEVMGHCIDEFIVPPEKEEEAGRLNEKVNNGEYLTAEVERETADGMRTFLVRNAPLDTDSEKRGYVIYADITELKENELRLEEQLETLEVLNQVVSHDIKNDLNVIEGRSQLLHDELEEERKEEIESVKSSAEHAIRLVTTARELTEAMLQTDTERESVALARIVESQIESTKSSYDDVSIEVDEKMPEVEVFGDDMLSSVFSNLLKNAFIHNDREKVEIDVSVEEFDEVVRVEISDNGPGIPDSQKKEVFGKGEKGLESPGTGLGLYLVRTLVERYGGEVWIEDNEPRGSTFVVELPKAVE